MKNFNQFSTNSGKDILFAFKWLESLHRCWITLENSFLLAFLLNRQDQQKYLIEQTSKELTKNIQEDNHLD